MPDSAAQRPSRISTIAIVLAAISAGLPALGIAAIHIGLAPPMAGFGMFGLGCVLGGLLTLLLGIAALIVTRGGTDPQGQRQAIMAVVLALGLFSIVYIGGRPGAGLPGINDITTNLDDPPAQGIRANLEVAPPRFRGGRGLPGPPLGSDGEA